MKDPSPNHPSDQAESLRRSTLQQYKMEATGVLIIAILILVVTLVHYWRHISWGLR